MNLKWFISGRVRRALAMHKHVWKILSHQRDILNEKAVGEVEVALGELKTAAAQTTEKDALQKQMDNLEAVANKWLKPYPNAGIRENVEMLLVALAVAMAIRTFFLQPFKIPTGSMQPTLYGVNSTPDFSRIKYVADPVDRRAEFQHQIKYRESLSIPNGIVARIKDFIRGNSYLHIVADEDGVYGGAKAPLKLLIFNILQTYTFNGKSHTVWFPPDYGSETLDTRAGLIVGQQFRKGDDIVKLEVQSGDYLFVNRMTYNFRPPARGDIVVFKTSGIAKLSKDQQDTFYIKRLVGLGGETLSINPDLEVLDVPSFGNVMSGNLVVDGKPLSASTPHFKDLYTFPATKQVKYEPNQYYGHALLRELAAGKSFTVGTNSFFVMGDNTMNSSDSRFWGDFPQEKVIGKSSFGYWPITKRWGGANR